MATAPEPHEFDDGALEKGHRLLPDVVQSRVPRGAVTRDRIGKFAEAIVFPLENQFRQFHRRICSWDYSRHKIFTNREIQPHEDAVGAIVMHPPWRHQRAVDDRVDDKTALLPRRSAAGE